MTCVTMIRMIIISLVIFSHEITGLRRRCSNTGVLFSDKISRSPIIVYGEPLGKRVYGETESELLFNVSFRVDCIFKGKDVDHRIEITDAGIKNGRTACQWLDPGKSYVVFLDRCDVNGSVYCPMDFQERLVDAITYELLEKTCYLTHLPPLNSISNNCPNVSMAEFCPDDQLGVKIIPKSQNEHPIMKTSFNHVHLQSNATIPNLVNHIGDNPQNHADFSSFASIPILLLALHTAMFL